MDDEEQDSSEIFENIKEKSKILLKEYNEQKVKEL